MIGLGVKRGGGRNGSNGAVVHRLAGTGNSELQRGRGYVAEVRPVLRVPVVHREYPSHETMSSRITQIRTLLCDNVSMAHLEVDIIVADALLWVAA
jgi:hypothetical protein